VLVLLGDQPLVDRGSIAAVVAKADPDLPAARAVFAGEPGHPVLIRRELFAEVARLEGDHGARELLERSGFTAVECGPSASADVDVPADLDRLRTTWRVRELQRP
jgi:molybdenum cofactor cytidylyltransferase